MRGAWAGARAAYPMVRGLPPLLQEDPLAVALVDALDSVLAPVPLTLDGLDAYLAPATAPLDWVRWLGSWVGAPDSPDGDARERLAGWHEVQEQRGTPGGLVALVRAVAGVEAVVTDSGGVAASPVPGGVLPGGDVPAVRVALPAGTPEAVLARVRGLVAGAVPPWVVVEVVTGSGASGASAGGGRRGTAAADEGSGT